MNYLDANHLLGKRARKAIALATEWKAFRTLPNREVSILAKIIVVYFRNGNCGRFVALSGALSVTMFV